MVNGVWFSWGDVFLAGVLDCLGLLCWQVFEGDSDYAKQKLSFRYILVIFVINRAIFVYINCAKVRGLSS